MPVCVDANTTQVHVGDVVRLHTPGPRMTVATIWLSGRVDCKWFVDATLHEGTFDFQMLQKETD